MSLGVRCAERSAFDDNVVFLAAIGKGRHPAGAEYGFQCPPDIADRHAEIAGIVAVDLDAKLRLGFLEVVIDVDEAWIVGLDRRDQDVAPLPEFLIGAAADDELHGLDRAAPEALPHHRRGCDTRKIGDARPNIVHDRPCRAAIAPVGQHDDGYAGC